MITFGSVSKFEQPIEDIEASSEAAVDFAKTEEPTKSLSLWEQRKERVLETVGGIFILFEGSDDSWFGKIPVIMISITITVAFMNTIISTIPTLHVTPSSCAHPICRDDTELCPGRMVCEPQPPPVFGFVDNACVYIFIIEYGMRFFTVWAVDARVADILPSGWNEAHDIDEPVPKYPLLIHYLRFILSWKNLIDLAVILPQFFFLGSALNYIRILRLVRIFELFDRASEIKTMTKMIFDTMKKSFYALIAMVIFSFIGTVFFASIEFAIESGDFRVTKEYPNGAYLRLSVDGDGYEISPYTSIPTAMYWVITTATTVGYGDIAPTSWSGRMVACTLMYCGIIILALPIGVLSSTFGELFHKYLKLHPDADAKILPSKETKSRLQLANGGDSFMDPDLLEKGGNVTAKGSKQRSSRSRRKQKSLSEIFFTTSKRTINAETTQSISDDRETNGANGTPLFQSSISQRMVGSQKSMRLQATSMRIAPVEDLECFRNEKEKEFLPMSAKSGNIPAPVRTGWCEPPTCTSNRQSQIDKILRLQRELSHAVAELTNYSVEDLESNSVAND